MRTGKFAAGITAAALSAMMMSFAAAADEPTGYVSFTAIASAIGQGFIVMPVSVPIYEGDMGVDIVKRAVGEDGIVLTESDYGAYVTGFANTDADAEIPAEIAAVCPEMTGRNAAGYLSALDYTAESGWSYFVNGEYAQVGITDYEPRDGDVLEFRFTVYGYGADLGIDNSGWGGAAALAEQVDASELIRKCAELTGSGSYSSVLQDALDVLGKYGTSQSEIDAATVSLEALRTAAAADGSDSAAGAPGSDGKGSPDTGVGGAAAAFGVILIAVSAAVASRKR